MDDPRVFERKEEVEIPGFSVDILIDASSSRKQMQEQIAAQAYILSKSLKQCKIPVQIYSYCSIRGYAKKRERMNCSGMLRREIIAMDLHFGRQDTCWSTAKKEKEFYSY